MELLSSDGIIVQDNKGCGYCGAISLFQADIFINQNHKQHETREGLTESDILIKIANTMKRIRDDIIKDSDKFSTRSKQTAMAWTDEV